MTLLRVMSKIKTKHLFIIQSFISNAIVIYPLYAIMFTERGGLTVGDVSLLFAIWTAAALVFELPTGLIADRFSRKHVLFIGELINTAAFLVWLLLPTFFGYALGFVLWGLAFALKSGAYQALVYDELAHNKQSDQYTKTMSRIKAAEFSGMLLAFVSASLLSLNGVNYNLLLMISISAATVSAVILLLLPSIKNYRTRATIESEPKLLKRAISVVAHNPRIRVIIAWLAIIGGFIGWYEEYTPLFDSIAGIETQYVPIVISIALVVNIVASLVAPRFEKSGLASRAALIFGAALMIVFSTLGWWLPVIVILAHGGLVLLRVLRILFDAELQHAADGSMRATLGSIAGLLSYPLTIGIALGFAVMSERLQDFLPFRWIGIALFACGILLLIHTRLSARARVSTQ